MAIRYPANWKELAAPHVRTELLAYLDEAAGPNAYRDPVAIEALVHFIFDDHDFVSDPAIQIGATLTGPEEARVLAPFVQALDAAIGPRRRSLTKISADDWWPVSTAAKAAHEALSKKGKPTFD